MKHGQSKAKAKDVKKTSPKKGPASSARKESKGASSSKEGSQRQAKVPAKASKTAGTTKVSSHPSPARSGKPAPSASSGKKPNGEVTFTNPAVANAFKRALKKYPVALKRLSD